MSYKLAGCTGGDVFAEHSSEKLELLHPRSCYILRRCLRLEYSQYNDDGVVLESFSQTMLAL